MTGHGGVPLPSPAAPGLVILCVDASYRRGRGAAMGVAVCRNGSVLAVWSEPLPGARHSTDAEIRAVQRGMAIAEGYPAFP